MKEVLAIIRPNRTRMTEEVLAAAGFPALTVHRVLGRGKQKGLLAELSPGVQANVTAPVGQRMEFIPKRLLSLVVPDGEVERAVQLIAAVNRTGHPGDGRVFVCPLSDALRVRTGERGEAAVL